MGDQNNIQEQVQQQERNEQIISWAEFVQHNRQTDCWVIIEKIVYDLTQYALKHPGGQQIIFGLAGQDGTQQFLHSGKISLEQLKKKIAQYKIGKIEEQSPTSEVQIQLSKNKSQNTKFSLKQIKRKNYFIIDNFVYDLKSTMELHPRGSEIFDQYKGKDATKAFQEANHPVATIINKEKFCKGVYDPNLDNKDNINNKSCQCQIF